MTNGEKIKEIFPDATVCYTNGPEIGLRPKDECWIIWFMEKWWNAEYEDRLHKMQARTEPYTGFVGFDIDQIKPLSEFTESEAENGQASR